MTRHVHAFGDDALGDLDAVALVDAIRTGKVSRPEVVEAAIARTRAVNPALNGLAHENFDQALARANAGTPYGGYFDGVPTFIKDNVDVEGMPTMQGTDAWEPRPHPGHGPRTRARVEAPSLLARANMASAPALDERRSGHLARAATVRLQGAPLRPPDVQGVEAALAPRASAPRPSKGHPYPTLAGTRRGSAGAAPTWSRATASADAGPNSARARVRRCSRHMTSAGTMAAATRASDHQ